jgi:hypothetical protein
VTTLCWYLMHLLCPAAGALIENMEPLLSSRGISYADAATGLVQAIKACLIDSAAEVSTAACQLVSSITSRAQPALLRHLLQMDVAEYIFELLRGCINTIAPFQQQSSSQGGLGSSQAAAASSQQEWLQALAVQSLRSMAHAAADFMSHAVYGLATLTALLDRSREEGDTALQAEVLSLLEQVVMTSSAASSRQPRTSPSDIKRLAAAVVAVLPNADSTAAEQGFRPTQEALACYIRATSILQQLMQDQQHQQDAALVDTLMQGLQKAARTCSIMAAESLQQGFLQAAAQLAECVAAHIAKGWRQAGMMTEPVEAQQQYMGMLQLLHDCLLPALVRCQNQGGYVTGTQHIYSSINIMLEAATQMSLAGEHSCRVPMMTIMCVWNQSVHTTLDTSDTTWWLQYGMRVQSVQVLLSD